MRPQSVRLAFIFLKQPLTGSPQERFQSNEMLAGDNRAVVGQGFVVYLLLKERAGTGLIERMNGVSVHTHGAEDEKHTGCFCRPHAISVVRQTFRPFLYSLEEPFPAEQIRELAT
jgi:hypothetical protein